MSQFADERAKELRAALDKLSSANKRVASLEMENSAQSARFQKVESELKSSLQRQAQEISALKRQLQDQQQMAGYSAAAPKNTFGKDSEESDGKGDDLEAEVIKGIAGSGISKREEALEEELAELKREYAGLQVASGATKQALQNDLRDCKREYEKELEAMQQQLQLKEEALQAVNTHLKQARADAQKSQAAAEKRLLDATTAAEDAARESAATLQATMADLGKSMAESAAFQTEVQEHAKANQPCKEALEEDESSAEQQKEEAAASIAQLARTSESQLQDVTEKYSRALQDLEAKLLAATEAAAAQKTEAAPTIADLDSAKDLLKKDLASANAQIEALQRALDARDTIRVKPDPKP